MKTRIGCSAKHCHTNLLICAITSFVVASSPLIVACHRPVDDSVLSGHYIMETKSGRYDLLLNEGGMMSETALTRDQPAITVSGKWLEKNGAVELDRFLRPDPEKPISLSGGSSLEIDHDYRGRLQLLVSDDFGWYFQKQ